MSAFMVDKIHIDLLVAVALEGPKDNAKPGGYGQSRWYGPYYAGSKLTAETANEVGEMLIKENLSSIHYRYPDSLEDPDNTPGPCDQYWLKPYQLGRHVTAERFPQPVRLTAIQALKAIQCYEYQSCEHPEWHQSDAKRFCEALRSSLVSCLPGYDDADWSIDSTKAEA